MNVSLSGIPESKIERQEMANNKSREKRRAARIGRDGRRVKRMKKSFDRAEIYGGVVP